MNEADTRGAQQCATRHAQGAFRHVAGPHTDTGLRQPQTRLCDEAYGCDGEASPRREASRE
eukprot:6031067-Prymnesium_polylepis.1